MSTRYFVDDDRWGNRWLFTPYWMIRCDIAKRLGAMPWKEEPGVYVKGERIEPLVNDKRSIRVEPLIRSSMQGEPVRLYPRREQYETGYAGQTATVYVRTDGALVYADVKVVKPSLGRLSDLPLFQFGTGYDNRNVPRGWDRAALRPIVANHRGQPAAILMPLRIANPSLVVAKAAA